MNPWMYLGLNALAFFFPLVLSFDQKVHFVRHWRHLFIAIVVIGVPYLVWDYFFTEMGVWGFNPDYLSGLELDVVVSKNNELVVSHEPWMNHQFCLDQNGNIFSEEEEMNYRLFNMDYQTISEYDCGSLVHPMFPNQKLFKAKKPLLKDVFELLRGRTTGNFEIILDIKSAPEWYEEFQPSPFEYSLLLKNFLSRYKLKAKIIITSADINLLNNLHRIASNFSYGLIVENSMSPSDNLNQLNFRPELYSLEHSMTNYDIIAELKAMEISLVNWTVNDFDDVVRLEEMGVTRFITDYPDQLLSGVS